MRCEDRCPHTPVSLGKNPDRYASEGMKRLAHPENHTLALDFRLQREQMTCTLGDTNQTESRGFGAMGMILGSVGGSWGLSGISFHLGDCLQRADMILI